jgi:Tol biopolymer transport system component
MKMSRTSHALVVVALLSLFGFSNLIPSTGLAAETPSLVDQRVVTFDETRIIGVSPDGSAIAAASWNEDRLCVFETETEEQRFCADLSPLESGLRLSDVAWSPDSTKLALSEDSFKYLIDGDLWVLDAFTGELTNLTDEGYSGDVFFLSDDEEAPAEVFLDVSPTWLPDSSAITFSRSIWRNGETAGNAIYTVPVDGGEAALETIVTLEMPGVVYFGMQWSDDLSTLYYSVNSPDASDPINGIWQVNADGLDATQVIAADDELGAPILAGLSPDGDTILAYYVMAAGQFSSTTDYLYALVDVPTGTVTPLIPEADVPGPAATAVLSPDGEFVVYVTWGSEPPFQVFIRPVAGGEETPLVPNGAGPVDLAAPITWSNTGIVLFTTSLLSEATLLTIDLTGAATPRITPELTLTPSPTATATIAPTETPQPTATPTPTSEPGPALGDVVYVNDNDVPLRAKAGIDEETVLDLPLGTELRVLGEPVEADGFTWIPVGDLATTTVGYVRSEFIDPLVE